MIDYPLYATEAYKKFVDDLVLARKAEGVSLDDLNMPKYLAQGIEDHTNYDIRDILWYADCLGLDMSLDKSLW
jgi:hypothetical protein